MSDIKKEIKKHSLSINNREKIAATGIARVDFFSEEIVTAQTDLGQLNIKGKSLYIEKLSAETGDMSVTGNIIAVSYTDNGSATSFLGRLLK